MYEIAPGYPDKTIDTDEYTFVGGLKLFFEELSVYRNQDTRDEYINLWYNKRLVPELPFNKALADYTNDDFDEAIAQIKSKYNDGYSDSTIERLRFLFWDVYEIGFTKGLYEDQLYWKLEGLVGKKELSEKEIEKRKVDAQLKKKSFYVAEEHKILDWITRTDISEISGKEVGLILMFFLGLRNNEACGLNFEDIKELPNYPKVKVAYIFKTVVLKSNELKTGGKTRNAARIIPVMAPLEEFLEKRLKMVMEQYGKEHAEADILKLPIASRDEDLSVRLSSVELTLASNAFFERLGLNNPDRFRGLHETLSQTFTNNAGISEPNLTAYLFRRNFATHLYCLGLEAGEIQYLIGHDVEDSNDKRNFYSNEERLKELSDKFKRHPYMVYSKEGYKEQEIKQAIEEGFDTLHIRIGATEPLDDLKLTVSMHPLRKFDASEEEGYTGIEITTSTSLIDKYPPTVDISGKMKEVFST